MSSPARVSLRGSGDTLSRRLQAVREEILANGNPEWWVYSPTVPGFYRCLHESDIPRAFRSFSRRGASICTVIQRRRLMGFTVCVDQGTDWLLLSDPVRLPPAPK